MTTGWHADPSSRSGRRRSGPAPRRWEHKGPAVGYSFHKSIAQEAHGNAERANFLGIGDALLDFRGGESGIGANGPVIYKRTAFDDLCAASNGDFRILKFTAGTAMANAQFGDLARTARRGVLMALTAGLSVIERPQTLRNALRFVEPLLISRVGGIVDHAVGLVIKATGRFRKSCGEHVDSNRQCGDTEQKFHGHLEAGPGSAECNLHSEKNKVENQRRY